MLLEPSNERIVIPWLVYLHNSLRKGHTSRNLYTPQGLMETEANGNIFCGSWRETQGEAVFIFTK